MVLTNSSIRYFTLIPSNIRTAFAQSKSNTPFYYESEIFHDAYDSLSRIWAKRESIRQVALDKKVSRKTIAHWQSEFIKFGALGLLPEITSLNVGPQLEKLIVLIKSARLHENSSYALRLSNALKIPGASLEIIRHTQRSHGYGQHYDKKDREYFRELQKILNSVTFYKLHNSTTNHNPTMKAKTFFSKDCRDSFQHKVELFRELSQCTKTRSIRPILRTYGIHHDRYYQLKDRFMRYGVWGLVDLSHCSKRSGEKISEEVELEIIEQRLMNPSLSPTRMMEKLSLKCSRANVQKIYRKWGLSKIIIPVSLRGVISSIAPECGVKANEKKYSAKLQFPDLIKKANLKVNTSFENFLHTLRYREIAICNPGAIIIAPFIHQLGIIEALHTFGPPKAIAQEIGNNILLNIIRIIAGFPTLHNFYMNSDVSVALGVGSALMTNKSRIYDSFDDLRFHHLLKLRNDLALRAKELDIIEMKSIAIDYHCDECDTQYPDDKRITKAPDKNGDMAFAHRPQIIWDTETNSIINIAYCEGRSRAPTALYKFLEENLFTIIEPDVVKEIYADSEYTGEKQLVYLIIRTAGNATMCLKQNKKIQKWRDEAIAQGQWQTYGKKYRITTKDVILQTGIPFRFVVKQNIETMETRCFGSTHMDWTPIKILDQYHVRWPVETGIKDLIENYFLNKPIGTSAEKNETHYYCIMAARIAVDFFLTSLAEPQWNTPQGWRCVLSTVRTTLFTSQNCRLSMDDNDNFQITYLDGDPLKIKIRLKNLLDEYSKNEQWKVPWWGDRSVKIKIKNQFA
jgi:hypothetical protein